MNGDHMIIVEGDGSTDYSAYRPDVPEIAAAGDSLDHCMREAGPARRVKAVP